jgi:thiol-disulfide isomerase/thioredoxin
LAKKFREMKFQLLALFLSLFFPHAVWSQIPVEKFDELETRWLKNNDTVYLVNYWATWCKPCVEELPDFLELEKQMKEQKFKMILVSLDFPSQIETRVIPFLKENKIKSEVVILDDKANYWINKVNEDWEGDIPVTQVIQNKEKEFYNSSLNLEELKEIVQPKIIK